jgi:hypothetical protein
MDFQSQKPAPHTATVWGVATVQVPQVVSGKSRNADVQFRVDFLSDIEKRSESFARR